MHTPHQPTSHRSDWLLLGGIGLFVIPGIFMRLQQELTGLHLPPTQGTLIYGVCILAAAFVISWTAEAAEMDIPQSLALAVLALIAVLPEYAVDIYFAWQAPHFEEYKHFAVANMTGANRLLIGFGWTLVFFLYFFKFRRPVLRVDRGHSLDVLILLVASVYSLFIVFRQELAVIDTVVLFGLFGAYVVIAGRRPVAEPELMGPAAAIGGLTTTPRRIMLLFLLVFSGTGIFSSAEPFAEGLLEIGHEFGIDQFLLVQWLAPLASEAPEMVIASLFVLRGRPGAAMGALIASQVNQWTLLVGCVPLAFAISGGSLTPLDFEFRQTVEVFLTGAQSFFGVAVFLSLSLSKWEGGALLGLFALQLFFPDPNARLGFAWMYMVLAAGLFIWQRAELREFLISTRQVIEESWNGTFQPDEAEEPDSPQRPSVA